MVVRKPEKDILYGDMHTYVRILNAQQITSTDEVSTFLIPNFPCQMWGVDRQKRKTWFIAVVRDRDEYMNLLTTSGRVEIHEQPDRQRIYGIEVNVHWIVESRETKDEIARCKNSVDITSNDTVETGFSIPKHDEIYVVMKNGDIVRIPLEQGGVAVWKEGEVVRFTVSDNPIALYTIARGFALSLKTQAQRIVFL